ncbi:Putative Zinc finger C2H2-type [Colletotrichum destructivum]|uniref:Zinc finger C2H2-type n=1 Tax=Colletotrichum destructivum TaxID=34406 RepID=A0AAX4IKX4_9PEZI|nr:Putative Zinc finger C2H2-type [Colletotrichum destructivum]
MSTAALSTSIPTLNTENSSSLFGDVCCLDAFTTPHRPAGDSELGSADGSDLAFVSEVYDQPPETLYTASETCDDIGIIINNELFRVPELTLSISSITGQANNTSPLTPEPTLQEATLNLVDGCLYTKPSAPSPTPSHKHTKKSLSCQRGCSLSFASPKDLRRHYGSEKHARGTVIKSYRCRCGYSTSPGNDHYRRHLRGIAESRPCQLRRPFFELHLPAGGRRRAMPGYTYVTSTLARRDAGSLGGRRSPGGPKP